ncbi:HAMP domain-containing protein [Lachnospiraceae bacterium LCP25S3_G4]
MNKPLTEELKSESEELADLQEAVLYLSNCLAESNEFLKSLRMGELDVKAPSRHNFLAGNLKELHSALKYLTWQANQVANGDYNQSVSFLGDFSTSFNQMIHQLAERESQ